MDNLPSGLYGTNDLDRGYEEEYGDIRHRRSRRRLPSLYRDGLFSDVTPERIIDIAGVSALALALLASLLGWNALMDALFLHIVLPLVVYATRILTMIAVIGAVFGWIRRRLFWF